MKLIENIYLHLPIVIQQLLITIYGIGWYKRRFSSHFHKLVKEFSEREEWNKQQFTQYQEIQFSKIITAAWKSKHYHDIFVANRISSDNTSLGILRNIPILSKETIRTGYKDLLTTNKLPKGTNIQNSSGTTGTPTNIYYSREFHALDMAASEVRSLNWAGVNYKDRRLMFGVRKVCNFNQKKPPFWRFSPAENMAYASIYHLSPKFIPDYLEFLRFYKPAIIMGYPSALFSIAQYALKNNDYPAPARAIITMAETLEFRVREVIETAWNNKILDRYGAVEGCVLVSQCEFGKYHVSPEVGIVEILDREGNPCPPGVLGEVICTGLQNDLQPLIRYRIGDVACWAKDQECKCKRQMPIIERIEGRFEDICYTSDGREMLRFDTVFKGVDNIIEGQVVQEHLGEFLINVIPSKGFSQHDIEKIKSNMRLHVGDVIIHIDQIQTIARSNSGKYRAVICNLSQQERESIRKDLIEN